LGRVSPSISPSWRTLKLTPFEGGKCFAKGTIPANKTRRAAVGRWGEGAVPRWGLGGIRNIRNRSGMNPESSLNFGWTFELYGSARHRDGCNAVGSATGMEMEEEDGGEASDGWRKRWCRRWGLTD